MVSHIKAYVNCQLDNDKTFCFSTPKHDVVSQETFRNPSIPRSLSTMSPTPALRRSRPEVQATAPKSSLQTSNPPATTASTTSFLILILILVALFPNLFHLIWSGPLHFLSPVHYLWHAHSRQDSFSSPQPPQRPANMGGTSWFQKQFTLPARSRGSYLITDIVLRELPEIREYKIGLLNLFIQHTSCALSLNENWDEVCSIGTTTCVVQVR